MEGVMTAKFARYGPDFEMKNETSLVTWDQNKTLNTADNTNRYFFNIYFIFINYNPNIDRFYLEKNKNKYSECWKLPEILDINYSNSSHTVKWQVMELRGITLFLYAAYFDTRKVCHEN